MQHNGSGALATATPLLHDPEPRPLRGGRHSVAAASLPLRFLEPMALQAARDAAVAAASWVGRGDPMAADGAATDAMREVLSRAPGVGLVVTGEGAKDGAPMLAAGELLGNRIGPGFELAVDPLECTSFCASGLPGALATLAIAESGALWAPGPAFYMDKLVVPRGAEGAIDLADPPETNLLRVARVLGKPVGEMRAVVLDKPRHRELIARLRATGARVLSPSAGDVAGSLAVLLPDGGADVLMGIGGAPEGLLTACAARALGGGMQIRLAPQRDDERLAIARAELSTRVLDLAELVRGDAFFVAAGVTTGELLRGPWTDRGMLHTESIVVAAAGIRRVVVATPLPARPT